VVVHNGYQPQRQIQTGIGAVTVKVPKTRDRSGSGIHFRPQLLPSYLRRTKSMEELIPWLYLKGLDERPGALPQSAGVLYLRYMDDILILATSRWKLRRAILGDKGAFFSPIFL